MPWQGILKELDLVRQYWIIRSSPTNQVLKIKQYHWELNCLGRRSLPIQCQIWMLSRPWVFSGTNPWYFTVAVFRCCRVTGKFSNQAKNCDSWGLVNWRKITNMKTHGCITSFILLCLLSWIIGNPSKHPIDTFTIYILKSNSNGKPSRRSLFLVVEMNLEGPWPALALWPTWSGAACNVKWMLFLSTISISFPRFFDHFLNHPPTGHHNVALTSDFIKYQTETAVSKRISRPKPVYIIDIYWQS